ncbi:MAG: SDR family oxidoreductase [Planctomycetia bacterium]|nr:SDR family oxidoreductase [Planctomycetia bacterium]
MTPRKILLTGATGGIGEAVARRFARNGDLLFLQGHANVEKLSFLCHELPLAKSLNADLSDTAAQDRVVETAWNEVRPGIDLFIQAAGIDILTGIRKGWTFEQKLDALLQVDVTASVRMARNVAKRMQEHGGGTILLFGWSALPHGLAGDSAELFSVAKGAVTAFAKSLAQKVGPTVRVLCIAPGWIRTAWGQNAPEIWQKRAEQTSLLNRWGRPEDVAEALFFLASPQAAFLNSIVLPIDGGERWGELFSGN